MVSGGHKQQTSSHVDCADARWHSPLPSHISLAHRRLLRDREKRECVHSRAQDPNTSWVTQCVVAPPPAFALRRRWSEFHHSGDVLSSPTTSMSPSTLGYGRNVPFLTSQSSPRDGLLAASQAALLCRATSLTLKGHLCTSWSW